MGLVPDDRSQSGSASSGFTDFWSNVFTLNLFSTNNVERERGGSSQYPETCQVIFKE